MMAASKSTPEIEFVDSCNDQIQFVDRAPEEALISADAPPRHRNFAATKCSQPAVLDMAKPAIGKSRRFK